MATAFQKFNCFVNDLADKVHDLATDNLYIGLTNTAPVATNTVYGNISEITAGNGYTAGGAQAAQVSSGQTSGLYKLVLGQPTFTASGGNIGPFRYAVLYNKTAAGLNLIGWYDYGTALTITSGNNFQVQTDQTNGVLQLQ